MRQLLGMQCGNGLMHESFDVRVDNLTAALKMPCTREIFEWANAMLVALVEETLGLDCDAEAQRLHLEAIRERWGQTEAGIDVYRNHSIDTVGAARSRGRLAWSGICWAEHSIATKLILVCMHHACTELSCKKAVGWRAGLQQGRRMERGPLACVAVAVTFATAFCMPHRMA
jgi:hypothetical protein